MYKTFFNKLQFILLPVALFFLGTLPQMLFAASGDTGPGTSPRPPAGVSFELKNPLAFGTLQEFIVAILRVIIVIAVPIVVIFIVLAGFKYVTARGNPNQIQEATRALTYAIIGGVLIIGAVAIAEIIENLVTAFSA